MSNPLYRNDRPATFPGSWYTATADIPPERPALRGQITADVCIVGAGFTGLMAALELAEHGRKVVVLDAHRAGWGASGRNGGQAGSGFNQDQRWIAARVGKGPARALWDMTEEGKALLKTRIKQHAPKATFRPGTTVRATSIRCAMCLGWQMRQNGLGPSFMNAAKSTASIKVTLPPLPRDLAQLPRLL